MSKKKANMFETAQVTREQEQAKIEATVIQHEIQKTLQTTEVSYKKEKIKEDKSDKITLSITSEDKLRVKRYALDHGTTVSDLVHMWICEHC